MRRQGLKQGIGRGPGWQGEQGLGGRESRVGFEREGRNCLIGLMREGGGTSKHRPTGSVKNKIEGREVGW